MRRFVTLSIALLFIGLNLNAQNKSDFVVEIQAGKKVLHVENLNLPATTCLGDLLDLFPELLAREGDSRLDNYDIQVNDFSLGVNKDLMLKYLKLDDIKSIEVSANPSTSQQKNGQGGLVKVKLKDMKEGFSGNAMVVTSSLVGVAPSVGLNYKKGAWAIGGTAIMEYYHPYSDYSRRESVFPDKRIYQNDTADIKRSYQVVLLDVKYTPGKTNKFHFWGWEYGLATGGDKYSNIIVNDFQNPQISTEKNREFAYLMGFNYTHDFKSSQLETEWTLGTGPSSYQLNKYNMILSSRSHYWKYNDNNHNTILTGLLKYKYKFINDGSGDKADLIVGGNIRYNPANLYYEFDKNMDGFPYGFHEGVELNSHSSLVYLSPYIESDNVIGDWFFKGGVRFQHYQSMVDVEGIQPFSRPENYVTAFLNAGYQIAPHHHLSLIVDRSISRSANKQIYPYEVYDPSVEYFTIGNPYLKPLSIHSSTLNYITDFTRNEHSFSFDVELKYINTDKLVQSEKNEYVISYKNDGKSDIFATNFQFLYSYRIFSLAVTANVFDNFTKISGNKDQFLFYNLSLVPSLSFQEGWFISAKFTYNSSIYSKTKKLSDYIYAETRFSKTWGRWTAYMELLDNFHDVAEDVFYGKAISERLYYNLHRPSLRLGCYVKF